jgi:hypothetical protein
VSDVAQIGKLEDLLGRIARNRRAVPVGGMAAVAHAAPVSVGSGAAAPMAAVPLSTPPLELAEPTTEERIRPPKPTPMEMALETELESRPDSEMDVEITIDEGPEISIDEEGELVDAAPTAPVGLRAPSPEPSEPEPAAPAPPAAPEPLLPRPIEVAAAKASAPIARVVSRPERREPTTFGELLGRTLALRPR